MGIFYGYPCSLAIGGHLDVVGCDVGTLAVYDHLIYIVLCQSEVGNGSTLDADGCGFAVVDEFEVVNIECVGASFTGRCVC